MFKYFGVEVQKKVEAQVIDEIGSSTLMGCGFNFVPDKDLGSEQGIQTPTPLVPSGSSNGLSVEVLQ